MHHLSTPMIISVIEVTKTPSSFLKKRYPISVHVRVGGVGNAQHADNQVGDGEVYEVLANVLRRLGAEELHHQDEDIAQQRRQGGDEVEADEEVANCREGMISSVSGVRCISTTLQQATKQSPIQ
ncbi:hypothetical protein TYRP_019517 [Tyrophagus putrescentiae]|nr:hypothetical protein TYRP_019517 [Tyrophagus putrescentiae]